MKTKYLALLPLLLLAGCQGNRNSTNVSGSLPNEPISTPNSGAQPGDSTSMGGGQGEAVYLSGGDINNALPTGWTFVKGPTETTKEQYYGNGGLKLQYIGDGVLSNIFSGNNHLEIKIDVRSKNDKGSNIGNVGDDPYSFSVYGLNSSNAVVAAVGILRADAAVVGSHNVVLEGPAITQVKVIYTSHAYDGSYYNLSLGGVTINGNNSGSGDITATVPSNPDSSSGTTTPPTPVGKLTAPANVAVSADYHITWDAVTNANQYRVYVNKENTIVYDGATDLDAFYLLEDGIVNTIKVQAIDTFNHYTTSDFTVIQYADKVYAGITIDMDKSNIKDAVIDTTNKTLTIPSNKLSRDASGSTPDIVLQFDYDETNYKFTCETNNTVLYSEKIMDEFYFTFDQPGELIVNVMKNGDKTDTFFYDTIKIIIEETAATFSIGYYDDNYEITSATTYDLVNGDYAYIWLNIMNGEGAIEGQAVWSIVSGTALRNDWSNENGSYYTAVYGAKGEVVISATYEGETAFITINVVDSVKATNKRFTAADDQADATDFINYFRGLRKSGDICWLINDAEEYSFCISVYDMMSAGAKSIVNNTADVAGATIGKTISYLKMLHNAKTAAASQDASSMVNKIEVRDTLIVLGIILVAGLLTYALIEKKKFIK